MKFMVVCFCLSISLFSCKQRSNSDSASNESVPVTGATPTAGVSSGTQDPIDPSTITKIVILGGPSSGLDLASPVSTLGELLTGTLSGMSRTWQSFKATVRPNRANTPPKTTGTTPVAEVKPSFDAITVEPFKDVKNPFVADVAVLADGTRIPFMNFGEKNLAELSKANLSTIKYLVPENPNETTLFLNQTPSKDVYLPFFNSIFESGGSITRNELGKVEDQPKLTSITNLPESGKLFLNKTDKFYFQYLIRPDGHLQLTKIPN